MAQIDTGRDLSTLAPSGDPVIKAEQALGGMWRDEGDDFFGAVPSAQAALDAEVNEEIGDMPDSASTPAVPAVKEKKKRRPRGTGPKKKPAGAAGE